MRQMIQVLDSFSELDVEMSEKESRYFEYPMFLLELQERSSNKTGRLRALSRGAIAEKCCCILMF